jgi:hypothetical protein
MGVSSAKGIVGRAVSIAAGAAAINLDVIHGHAGE